MLCLSNVTVTLYVKNNVQLEFHNIELSETVTVPYRVYISYGTFVQIHNCVQKNHKTKVWKTISLSGVFLTTNCLFHTASGSSFEEKQSHLYLQ